MIYLKYKTGATTADKAFNELSLYELPAVDRLSATTLRGRAVSHRRWSRRIWSLVITSDLVSNDVEWIKLWWTAEEQWIALEGSPTQWIAVVTEGGTAPIEYVDGFLLSPESALEITEKYGS